MESIEQTFNGVADFGRKVTCTVSRNGDLIHKTYLRVELDSVEVPKNTGKITAFRWLDWIGHLLVKSVEIEIGGQRIDKHYGDWLHIWNELTQTAGHQIGYANMVGNTPDVNGIVTVLPTDAANKTVGKKIIYVPLQFWFCRNPGLALPLIALQYHEVKINVEFNDVKNCYWAGTKDASTANASYTTDLNCLSTTPSMASASLFIDYIYLDTEERRRFAQTSHEYLIEQLQFTGDESVTGQNQKIKLNYNHPCKAIYFVVQPDTHVNTNQQFGAQWFNFSDTASPVLNLGGPDGLVRAPGAAVAGWPVYNVAGNNPVVSAKLQLNGHDRFSERDGRYFNIIQPYQHHENIPSVGINVYSFGLKPEEHQPSGTCNMSRIDNATLSLTLTDVLRSTSCKVRVYAVNINILRVLSGMGGLSYSN